MSVVPQKNLDLVRWYDQISMDDVAIVGGKNASLAEMFRELTPRGIGIPDGFATTAEAYRNFLVESGLGQRDSRDPE